MNKTLAFVLSGGGARGALQVGALQVLLEAGYLPDLLVGTSIGAVNAAFLALNGFSPASLSELRRIWDDVSRLDLLPANYVWLTVRAMFGRSAADPSRRIRDFFISNGITPDLCFSDLRHPRLVIVSSDLGNGKPVLHGVESDENVLDALLLSTALPPWVMPVKQQDRIFMDGGVVSNLPVEPAIKCGATEIIALDLIVPRDNNASSDGMRGLLGSLVSAVHKRQADLELELARAHGIPITYVSLYGSSQVPVWDFTRANELVAQGYEITAQTMERQRDGNVAFTDEEHE